ncbi:MAG TPA: tetratricopeptide repeat protein, partial [Gaiellaceae bacterium]|nr:tetratricopeptide repeat protein [Gaiellaceae bacterium]
TALAEVALLRDADLARARELADEALAVLAEASEARFDALRLRGEIAWVPGDLAEGGRYAGEALEAARALGRKDLEAKAIYELANTHALRMRYEEAEPLLERARQLADESGSITARATAARAFGAFLRQQGEIDQAEALLSEAAGLFAEAGIADGEAYALGWLGWSAFVRGDLARAERLFRDVVRILTPLEDRGFLPEGQRGLAEVLLAQGRVEEAERLALAARDTVSPWDITSRASTTMALGLVRAAQGRDEEAESLLREALALLEPTDFRRVELEPLAALAEFLVARGRHEEAEPLLARLGSALPGAALGRADAVAAALRVHASS